MELKSFEDCPPNWLLHPWNDPSLSFTAAAAAVAVTTSITAHFGCFTHGMTYSCGENSWLLRVFIVIPCGQQQQYRPVTNRGVFVLAALILLFSCSFFLALIL